MASTGDEKELNSQLYLQVNVPPPLTSPLAILHGMNQCFPHTPQEVNAHHNGFISSAVPTNTASIISPTIVPSHSFPDQPPMPPASNGAEVRRTGLGTLGSCDQHDSGTNSWWREEGKSKPLKVRKKLREPRFCFQTRSDVDVLDDGYKWRKYGQKVVKNSLHPRSYYRCTHTNCRVKKKIERLSDDCRMVITTYEGRHTHLPYVETNSFEQEHYFSAF